MPSSISKKPHSYSREYRCFSSADISHLTSVLTHPPPTPSNQGHLTEKQDRLKAAIRALPPHLHEHNMFRRSSSLCNLHRTLPSIPITSLSRAFERTLTNEVTSIWTPLLSQKEQRSDLSPLLTPEHTRLIAHLTAHLPLQAPCPICRLSLLATDVALLISAGCIMMAKLSPRLWKCSTRLKWVEALILTALPGTEGVKAVATMMELGKGLREARLAFLETHEHEKVPSHPVNEAAVAVFTSLFIDPHLFDSKISIRRKPVTDRVVPYPQIPRRVSSLIQAPSKSEQGCDPKRKLGIQTKNRRDDDGPEKQSDGSEAAQLMPPSPFVHDWILGVQSSRAEYLDLAKFPRHKLVLVTTPRIGNGCTVVLEDEVNRNQSGQIKGLGREYHGTMSRLRDQGDIRTSGWI